MRCIKRLKIPDKSQQQAFTSVGMKNKLKKQSDKAYQPYFCIVIFLYVARHK
jgi:hypothetical protein